jgi:hypothetical protein
LAALSLTVNIYRPAQPQKISDGIAFNRGFYSRFLDFHREFDQFQRIQDLFYAGLRTGPNSAVTP